MAIEEQVGEGRFRNDLFYRLNSVTVRIPPLRDRGGDTMLLARYFLGRFNREFGRKRSAASPSRRSRRSATTPGRAMSASWKTA